jgi:hypothetical protein
MIHNLKVAFVHWNSSSRSVSSTHDFWCVYFEPYLGCVTRVTTRRREGEDFLRIDMACTGVAGLDKGLSSSCNTTNSTRRPSYQKHNNIIYYNQKLINLNPDSKLKYKAFLIKLAKAWTTYKIVAAEPESDTDLVRLTAGTSTPTPRRLHVDLLGRPSDDMK